MKVAVYSPYLDTFGGGERYMMTLAEVLSSRGQVDVLLDKHLKSFGSNYLKKNLQERFGVNLSTVSFVEAPVGRDSNFFRRFIFTKAYDLMFYLTDGSIFVPAAKQNILHIQTPIRGQAAVSVWGKIKLASWNLIIYNSNFTRDNCQQWWPARSEIVYPPVDTIKIKPLKKEKYILSVGRFFGFLKNKKHEFLIKAFKELYKKKEVVGWSLHLVGAASEGDEGYINHLKKLAKGLPVHFYPNLNYDSLIELYGKASIYWHAAGFDEEDPANMEHFGITTVEAMAGGCVVVVIGKGGQPEIVRQEESGFLWTSLVQLEEFTLRVIGDRKLFKKISLGAVSRSQDFSKKRFAERILAIINAK